MRYLFGFTGAAAALVVATGSALPIQSGGDQRPALPLAVTALESPAASGSGQPNLSVSSRGVLLSWVEREGSRATLKFSERTNAGWSPARTVAAGDDWFVNWADVPSVIRREDGTLVAHWLQKSGPGTYAYDVRLSHSTDDGRTWSSSFRPHHDGTPTEHGFASLFAIGRTGLGLVWLDGREMRSTGHAPAPGASGAMTLRYGVFDRSWTQTHEDVVDARVCECCPTAAAITAEGPIVAYRNRSDQEIRDIYVSRLEGSRWSAPIAVSNDNWQISGCPVNGPAVAARDRRVVVAWYTGAENQPRAFVAFSNDAGRSFGPRVRLDDAGSLGRVDVELLEDGSAIASWIEYAARSAAEFRVRRLDSSGRSTQAVSVTRMQTDRSSGYPRFVHHGNDLVFAWTETSSTAPAGPRPGPRVRTAVAPVPR